MNQRGAVILGALALCLAVYAIVAQSLTSITLSRRMELMEIKRARQDEELAGAINRLADSISPKSR